MSFQQEPTSYEKGILSDLQGAWACLRSTAVELPPLKERNRLIFHIDEGMSWESVRDLERMKITLLIIFNIVQQNLKGKGMRNLLFEIEELREMFNDVYERVRQGDEI